MIFKMLAMRLNNDFQGQKNLKKDYFYKFSDDFQFLDKDGVNLEKAEKYDDVKRIVDIQSYPDWLYSIAREQSPDDETLKVINVSGEKIDINISAIVGRNGAGKSSLLEIFYLFIFCISESKKYISHRRSIATDFKEEALKGKREILDHSAKRNLNSTDIEFYYRLGDLYYLIKRTKGHTEQYILNNDEKKWESKRWDQIEFFYTVAVNYSQYSLNAQWGYYWLRPLFHKNDGYQTPLVLNPFRDEGNIDINRETHLAQIRLLTNLSHEQFRSVNLIDDKEIFSVTFHVRPSINGIINGVGEGGQESVTLLEVANVIDNKKTQVLTNFFTKLLTSFDTEFESKRYYKTLMAGLNLYLDGQNVELGLFAYKDMANAGLNNDAFRLQMAIYILTKALKICNKYPKEFRRFTEDISVKQNDGTVNEKTVNLKAIKSLGIVTALFKNGTHITLKIRQAINVLIHGQLIKEFWQAFPDDQSSGNVAFQAVVPFKNVREQTQKAFGEAKYDNKHLSHFIPAVFFTPVIRMSSPSQKEKFLFSDMSSGEQQLIHSVHSVLYHILNLDSINYRKLSDLKIGDESYSYVNVILDEIELYYHPKYQRQFVKFFLENIKKVNLQFIKGINILFSTHSPFILSDIPGVNVLRLDDGQPLKFKQEQTFGANIHDMLADSFFMGESLIGEFAEHMINECISLINEITFLKEIEKITKLSNIQKVSATRISLNELSRRLKNLPFKIDYQSHADAMMAENKSKNILHRIRLVGEQVIRIKLMEMYDYAMEINLSEKQKALRKVQELMRQNNLNKEDLQ